jgi:hypothetical protein
MTSECSQSVGRADIDAAVSHRNGVPNELLTAANEEMDAGTQRQNLPPAGHSAKRKRAVAGLQREDFCVSGRGVQRLRSTLTNFDHSSRMASRRGWGPWRQKVAREVTVAELAGQVESLVTP